MPRDRWDEDDYPRDDPRRVRHSALGIISFVAAVLAGIGIFSLIVVAGFLSVVGDIPDDSPQAVTLGLVAILCLILALLALILGVVGLFQGGSRLFPTLGTVAALLVLLGSGVLAVVGALAG